MTIEKEGSKLGERIEIEVSQHKGGLDA